MFAAFDEMLRRNKIRSKDLAAVAMAGGTAKIPVVAQRLSSHTKTSVITAMQPGLATAVGAVKLSARQPIEQRDGRVEETTMAALVGASTGGFATMTSGLATTGRFLAPTGAIGIPTGTFGASTGTFDIPTAGALFDDPSERLTELAWSQADDSDDEPVFYTGEPYDTDDNRATPSQLMQLPRYEPPDVGRGRGTRLPQLFLGLAALVSMVAIGGVAFTLTSSTAHADAAQQQHHGATAAAIELAASVAEPDAAASAQRGAVADRGSAADQRGAPAAASAASGGDATATTAAASATNRRRGPRRPCRSRRPRRRRRAPPQPPPPPPPPPTTASTAPAMTTTYLNLPFLPMPIPVQVPEGQGGASQQPQNPYQQQNPYQATEPLPAESVPAEPVYAAESLPGPGYGY